MSEHEFEEVTTESWGSRITDSIKGILGGIVLFLASFVLLFWNEGRAVQTQKSLEEGQGAVITVDPSKIDPSNEGKLIHFTGKATTDEVLRDPTFGVEVKAIKLIRKVEMYQWVEEKKEKRKKEVGGTVKKKVKYKYKLKWSEKLIDSSEFHKKGRKKHQNPASMPYKSKTFYAKKVKVASFLLPKGLVEAIGGQEELALDKSILEKLPADIKDKAKIVDNRIYVGDDPNDPKVGDLRISFHVVRPHEVSVIGQQHNNTLQPYMTKAGDKILMLEDGVHSAQEMFAHAMASNELLTWLLRLLGFLMMFGGLALLFEPVAVFLDVLPILGNLFRIGVRLAAGVVAALLSIITIAVAWLFYRPLIAIGLLVLGGALTYAFYLWGKKKRQSSQEAAENG